MIEAERERGLTVEEFERIAPLLNGPSELINGRLHLMSPTSIQHGFVAMNIGAELAAFVKSRTPRPGMVVAAETGFMIDDALGTVIAPDAAFIKAERLQALLESSTDDDDPKIHFLRGAPDLVVEVLSPSDSMRKMLAKARQWLEAGTQEVWLVDCQREQIRVLHLDRTARILTRQQSLTSPELLPGFTLSLNELFTWF